MQVDTQTHEKVRLEHRKRNAYLYIRQSTMRQVAENIESTQRQYGLQERAVALGWDRQQIVVIDSDLGQSGASAADREGFQALVAAVGLGRAGIVLGLEVSRLARNSSDWHQLIELCARADTLILDEDGIYDPGNFNDRLVLGIKGTLSEAELHVLHSRMRGGTLNKARRGELAIPLPVGFLYDGKAVTLDPDQQVQQSIRQVFAAFRRDGSVTATVREFRQKGWDFPARSTTGPRPGDLSWAPLTRNQLNSILHNPRYAGAYAYGQHRHGRKPDGSGRTVRSVAREQWFKLDSHAHAGYLSWEDYEENLKRLRDNAPRPKAEGQGAPREGPALLQGLAHCGVCGGRIGIRYHHRQGKPVPDYVCDHGSSNRGEPPCQLIGGRALDEAIGKLLIAAVTPVKLELALAVQKEIEAQDVECGRLRQMQVERAGYEAGLAERRFKRVDPENRLVAGTLEAEWNVKLRLVAEAQQEYDRLRVASEIITAEARQQILRLAEDFPKIWQDPQTPDRERKRMVRLLLEDVTLLRDPQWITAHIRFKGGATQTVQVPSAGRTDAKTIDLVERLLQANHTYGQIAGMLNQHGMCTVRGKSYHGRTVRNIVVRYLPNRLALPSKAAHKGKPKQQDNAVPSSQSNEFGGAV